MKFNRSNKFDLLCYYGQVNSLRLKPKVASKWANKQFGGYIYFAGDSTSQLLPIFRYATVIDMTILSAEKKVKLTSKVAITKII